MQQEPELDPQPLFTPGPSLDQTMVTPTSMVQNCMPLEIGSGTQLEPVDDHGASGADLGLLGLSDVDEQIPDELSLDNTSELPLAPELPDLEVDDDALFGFQDDLDVDVESHRPPPENDDPVGESEETVMLQEWAASDPKLRDAMYCISNGKATEEQKEYYQGAFETVSHLVSEPSRHASGSGKQIQSKGLDRDLAALEAVSEAEVTAVLEALRTNEATSPTARRVLAIMDRVREVAEEQNRDLDRTPLSLGNSALYYSDLMSLFWVEGHESTAYIGDVVFRILLGFELGHVPEVHYFSDASVWFAEVMDLKKKLLDDIHDVDENGQEPRYGWPLSDVSPETKRILFPFNPSRNHWVGIEAHLQHPPRIHVYNSWTRGAEASEALGAKRGKSGAFKDALECLPIFFQLASRTPGSPLAVFNWEEATIVPIDCPQQHDLNIDCGPWVIFFLVRLAHHGHVAAPVLDSAWLRHAFGQWLRSQCVAALYSHCFGWEDGDGVSGLGDLFDRRPTADQLRGWYPEPRLVLLPNSRSKPPQKPLPVADRDLTAMIEALGNGGDGEWRQGPWRICLGDDDERVKSIIITIRWSSRPKWLLVKMPNEQVIQRVKALGHEAFRGYKKYAPNDARTANDVIILASCLIQTRLFPQLSPQEDEESQHEAEEANPGPLLTVKCSVCNWTAPYANSKSFQRSYWARHVGTHMLQDNPLVRSGDLWKAECLNCEYLRTSPLPSGPNRLRQTFISHLGSCFSEEWLSDNAQYVAFHCNCGDSDCQVIWTHDEWSEFRSHAEFQTTIGSKCPFCERHVASLQQHVSYRHIGEDIPRGWFSCELPADSDHATWHELLRQTKDILSRLKFDGKTYCAWSIADEFSQHCTHKTVFKNIPERRRHYNAAHKDHIWPFQHDTRCSHIYPTERKLQFHQHRVHGVNSMSSIRDHSYRRRAIVFTHAITADLLRAAGRDPVLLSQGTDGFTCNTSLIKDYLHKLGMPFRLVIHTHKLGKLEEAYLTRIGEVYWGSYESQTLLGALDDRASATPAYQDLLRIWDRLQAMKDEEVVLRVPRNRMLQAPIGHDSEDGDDIIEEEDAENDSLFVS
jgi:hypothetical protein